MSSVVSSVIGGQAQENVAQANNDMSMYGINTNAATSAAQLAEQSKEYQQTYGLTAEEAEHGMQASDEGLANAAAGMANSANIATPALQAEQGAIESGATRSMQDTAKQVGANLATSGVRGGQAATLQNRAVGEVGLNAEENIDQLLAQQAAATQAQQAGYYTQMAGGAMSKA